MLLVAQVGPNYVVVAVSKDLVDVVTGNWELAKSRYFLHLVLRHQIANSSAVSLAIAPNISNIFQYFHYIL